MIGLINRVKYVTMPSVLVVMILGCQTNAKPIGYTGQNDPVGEQAKLSSVVPDKLGNEIQSCRSDVTLEIVSSNYSGPISIELREGKRPGSKRLHASHVNTRGEVSIDHVCPGVYFFTFSTPDSPTVSVTDYFNVKFNPNGFSNTRIRVTYTRSKATNPVQRIGRNQL